VITYRTISLNLPHYYRSLIIALGIFSLSVSVFPTTVNPQQLSAENVAAIKSQIETYEQLWQKDPNNQLTIKSLLDLRLQLADIRGSLILLSKLADLNPQIPEYTVLLAQTKEYLGDREGAVLDYRKALVNHPYEINALQGLAGLLLAANRPEAAIGLVQDTIKSTTVNPTPSADVNALRLLLAQIYASQKKFSDSLSLYDESIAANSQDFRPIVAKALVLKEMGNLSAAQILLDNATAIAPSQYRDQIKQMAQNTQPPTQSLPTDSPVNLPSPKN
jgi:tetratricopeptide (TPR) repeat protein